MSVARHSFRITPGGALRGTVHVPGDKSISHRAVMLGALAQGDTEIRGLLGGEDVLATVGAFQALGVQIDGPREGRVRIHGVGLGGLQDPGRALDMGNSATAMRLMAGLLAGQSFDTQLIGDASLSARPMTRVVEPLTQMGARITCAAGGRPPLTIRGTQTLRGIDYELPVASAQVKSAVLLAGLFARGTTCVREPVPTRDHTERMLAGFGWPVERAGETVRLRGGGTLRACALDVPGDISSAAFFLVGASIAPGSELLLPGVGINPTRTGVIHILREMGADIRIAGERDCGGEPVADLVVRAAPLVGIRVPKKWVASAIDEFPVLAVAAACASGETVIDGAGELRVKESDRIATTAAGLQALGIDVQERADGLRINAGILSGGAVESRGDHRIAMAFAMAGPRAAGEIHVHECANVATSFPGFAERAAAAGLGIQELKP